MRLILASASPRRRALLRAAGFSFEVDAAAVDERLIPGEDARTYARRVARDKAEVVAARHPDAAVLGADTIVVVDEDVLGKPLDAADARRMLRALSGRSHEVVTAVAVRAAARLVEGEESTTVWMRPMNDQDIETYVSTGEPMDKAGAYAIQGLASRFITRIDGAYDNVVGLPVAVVARLLGQL